MSGSTPFALKIGCIKNFVSEYAGKLKPKPAVGLVIKKSDLCKHRDRDLLDITNYIKMELFDNLFKRDPGWRVSISSVSVGERLDEPDAQNWKIEPVNLEKPIFFAIHSLLYKDYSEAESRMNKASREQKAALQEIGKLQKKLEQLKGSFLSFFFKREKIKAVLDNIEKKNEAKEKAEREYNLQKRDAEELKKKINLIIPHLNDHIELYENGSELSAGDLNV